MSPATPNLWSWREFSLSRRGKKGDVYCANLVAAGEAVTRSIAPAGKPPALKETARSPVLCQRAQALLPVYLHQNHALVRGVALVPKRAAAAAAEALPFC